MFHIEKQTGGIWVAIAVENIAPGPGSDIDHSSVSWRSGGINALRRVNFRSRGLARVNAFTFFEYKRNESNNNHPSPRLRGERQG